MLGEVGLNYGHIIQLLHEQFFNNELVDACDENFKKNKGGESGEESYNHCYITDLQKIILKHSDCGSSV